MKVNYFDLYLISINIIGFILFAVNTWLYNHTADKEIDGILTVITLFGASLGVFISILVFDRDAIKSKQKKEIMMSRVFIVCVLVIQIIFVLIVKGFIKTELSFAFWEYFKLHKWLLIYLIAINIITIIAFGIDKYKAVKHKSRIRIVTLLSLAFIGGSVCGLIAMYVFKHKTKKDYFSIGIPLMIIMQIFLLFFIMNFQI